MVLSLPLLLCFLAFGSAARDRGLDRLIPSSQQIFESKELRINLGGDSWDVRNSVGNVTTTGSVPGEIHGDLLRAGVLGDPYYRYNDVEYRWVALVDWSYSRTFEVTSDLIQNDQILLICYGIDTVSSIFINGQLVGTTDNQFRRYIFSIKSALLVGLNRIEVKFQSAGTYATSKAKSYPYPLNEATSQEHSHGELFRNFIRKESCSFAWDWGPCFMPQGIWKPIEIVAYSSPLLVDVYPQVFNPQNNQFKILVSADIKSPAPSGGKAIASVAGIQTSTNFQLNSGDNKIAFEFYIPASQVNLWWPVGYGQQPLYDLAIDFIYDDGTSASEVKRIGFRTAELVEDPYPDQKGTSFYFRINGVPIWSKGSNLIPLDSFESRVTVQNTRRLLQNVLDANMNTVRIWGGGVYQSDYLYDLADELGLLVWEEFMFACALYPSDDDFLETVKEEAIYQIKRLIHHTSIVIWSGNNENEQAITERWFPESIRNPYLYAIDYDRLYHQTIRETLVTIDTSRRYISSSPANGVISLEPFTERWVTDDGETSNSQKYGDNHFYNYIPDCEDVTTMVSPRFSSEFGFQSMPSYETFKSVSQPSDWIWNSPFFKFRNHRTGDGQQEIANQMQIHFLFPTHPDKFIELENFVYLSQASQSLCYRAQTEHYRRSKTQTANTMGALYWQLNDIWQAPTWSSLEYGGRWKMLHYYAKNFFSPLLVSSYLIKSSNTYDVHVTSDVVSPLSGSFTLDIWSWSGVRRNTTVIPFELASLGSKSVLQKPLLELSPVLTESVFILTVEATTQTQDKFTHRNFFFPTKVKNSIVPPASISWKVTSQNGDIFTLTLTSNNIAPFTFLDTPISGRFSDNGFFLLPNQQITVQFFAWEQTTIEILSQNLRVRSLSDALPQ